MSKLIRCLVAAVLLTAIALPSAGAYEAPPRQIEIKPYFSFFFPQDLWDKGTEPSPVANKSAFGFGAKIRTQFSGHFGIVLNASYYSLEVADDLSGDGVMFTAGGYYARALGPGRVTFDLGYGVIAAADEALPLLMPALEYSYQVSERLSLAIELGWPIPNDWPRNLEHEESFGSFTFSLGTSILL
jgi:hypothetical protein